MKDLDLLEATLLERARRGYSASASSQSRVQSAALAAVAAGAVVPLATPSVTLGDLADSLRDGLTLPRVLVTVVALGSVGAGGYALGLRDGMGRVPAVSPPSASVLAATKPEAEAAPQPQAEQSPAPTPPKTENKRSAPASAAPALPSAVAASPATASELELGTLRRVERVLREGNPRFALALLADLDKSAPRGNLMEERHAARAVATCQLGTATTAAATATGFDARFPGSVYAARVHEACASATEPDSERNLAPAETDADKEEVTP
jgi:hypothetical protein